MSYSVLYQYSCNLDIEKLGYRKYADRKVSEIKKALLERNQVDAIIIRTGYVDLEERISLDGLKHIDPWSVIDYDCRLTTFKSFENVELLDCIKELCINESFIFNNNQAIDSIDLIARLNYADFCNGCDPESIYSMEWIKINNFVVLLIDMDTESG